jgi:DNA-binding beta-propeller fold protein YncE
MMQDSRTPNRNYPLPHRDNTLQDDVVRLGDAFQQIDTDVHQLQQSAQQSQTQAENQQQQLAQTQALSADNQTEIGNLQQRLDDANDVYELIKAATQVMQSGGTFTPTAEAMYPDVTSINVDTQWLLRFASVDASLTFTAGDLKDQTAHSGDILFYNTPSNAFILIPSAQTQLLNDAVAKAVSDAKADTALQVAAARVATETQALDLVNRLFFPIGSVHEFALHQPQAGFLKCDGALYNKADYPELAQLLGDQYTPDGSAADQFAVPHISVSDSNRRFKFVSGMFKQRHTLTENIGNPYGCALADGLLYVVNNYRDKVQVYDASSGAHLHEFSSHISNPHGCAVHQGRLYVANYSGSYDSQVAVFDTASQAWQKNLDASGYQSAYDVCFAGAHYYVCNYRANTVSQFRLDGTLVRTINTSDSYATYCAVWGERLYVSHTGGTYDDQISVYNTNTGACIDHIDQGFLNPYGLCIDAGKLYVADCSNHRVAVLDAMSGALLHELTVEGCTNPWDVAIEAGKLAVSWNNNRVTLHDLAQPLEQTAYIRALPVT